MCRNIQRPCCHSPSLNQTAGLPGLGGTTLATSSAITARNGTDAHYKTEGFPHPVALTLTDLIGHANSFTLI